MRVNKASKMKVRLKSRVKAIAQEHALGCAVACVAFRCRISYSRALELFTTQEKAWTTGFFCVDLLEALARKGYQYEFAAFAHEQNAEALEKEGTIVFIGYCEEYPAGHYLVRGERGWMNPW